MSAAFVLLAALVAQPPVAHAPGSPKTDAPAADAIAQAIRDLGADDYHARERATTWLWSAGVAVESALREALKSTDAEVVARARDLLDKIPYGITPDMPRRFVELIARARAGGSAAWAGVVPELLDMGPRGLEVANKLTDRLAVNPGQRTYLVQVLDQEGWRVAPHLLANGRDAEAEDLLERSAVAGATTAGEPATVRHYAAVLKVRNRLTDQLPRWRSFAEKNDGKDGPGNRLTDGQPSGKAAAVILTYLARAQGDQATARWAADRAGRVDLREAVLFDGGDWAELAALPPSLPGNVPIMRVGLQAILFRAAGKATEADKALAELKSLPTAGSSTAPPLLFRALMFAQRPNEALAVLADAKGLDAVVPRFEILAQRNQYTDAFEAIDRPINDRSLYRWQRDTARARIYHQLGDQEKLRSVLRGVQQFDRLSPTEATPAQELIEQLVALHLQDEALPVAAAVLNSGVSEATIAELFGKLAPKTPLAAEMWWRYLRLQRPTAPMRETVARLPSLLDARLNTADGKTLIEAAATTARAQPPADADRWLQGLGEACQAAGLGPQARAFYEEATRRAESGAAWQKFGEFLAEQGQFKEAAVAFEKSWRTNVKQPLPLWLAGWAKTKAGDPTGKAAIELAHTLPLGDEDLRGTFAEELLKRIALAPEAAEAARRERRLTVQLGLPTSNRARNAQGFLNGDPLAYADRLAAADSVQRFLLRMLQTNAYFKRHEGYLVVLHRLHDHQARGLLAKGDVAGAVREADAAHAVLPSQAGLAVALVPELVKRGQTKEADAVYGKVAAVLDGLCKDYPQSAYFANQRAWLAARCRRDLEKAQALATRAAELSPKTAAYQETLAEIHFQRGERDQALARLGQALAIDPKNEFYLKQKARIEAGDPAAPVPEINK